MKILLITILLIQTSLCSSQIVLSEMQSSNSTTVTDDFGEYDDWVELHNTSSDSVEISGLILKDQLDTWVIPSGNSLTHLPPGGYFILWADDQEAQGMFHTNFKLASGGEFLGLYESDGTTVIDSVTIPALNSDYSFIRCQNDWMTTSNPTPLTSNDCPASLNDLNLFDELFIIKNIGEGNIEIELVDKSIQAYQLSIYALDGKTVCQKTLTQSKAIIPSSVNNTGVYLISLTAYNSVHTKRLWIEK